MKLISIHKPTTASSAASITNGSWREVAHRMCNEVERLFRGRRPLLEAVACLLIEEAGRLPLGEDYTVLAGQGLFAKIWRKLLKRVFVDPPPPNVR